MAFLDLHEGILEEFVSTQQRFSLTADAALFRWYARMRAKSAEWKREHPEARRRHRKTYRAKMTPKQKDAERAMNRRNTAAYRARMKARHVAPSVTELYNRKEALAP